MALLQIRLFSRKEKQPFQSDYLQKSFYSKYNMNSSNRVTKKKKEYSLKTSVPKGELWNPTKLLSIFLNRLFFGRFLFCFVFNSKATIIRKHLMFWFKWWSKGLKGSILPVKFHFKWNWFESSSFGKSITIRLFIFPLYWVSVNYLYNV